MKIKCIHSIPATTFSVLRWNDELRITDYELTGLGADKDSLPVPVAYSRFASLPQAGETDFTNAAELSVNAVVHVKTTYRNQVSSQQMDLYEFFFGRPGQQREMPAQQATAAQVPTLPPNVTASSSSPAAPRKAASATMLSIWQNKEVRLLRFRTIKGAKKPPLSSRMFLVRESYAAGQRKK